MQRGLIRFGAAILALTVALVGNPAGAAVVDPVRTGFWTFPQCATGDFTGARWIQGSVQVLGTAEVGSKCAHVDGAFFAVAVYHLGVPEAAPYATLEDARFYHKGRSRAFGVEVFQGAGTETVCLLSSPEKRLACADITATAARSVTIQPRDINDPAVSGPAKLGRHDPTDDNDGKPSCATCF